MRPSCRFFGRANSRANVQAYDAILRHRVDPVTRAYWDARGIGGRRRISMFTRNFYRHGLLGRCIGVGHALARLHGLDPSVMLQAHSLAHQRVLFDRRLAPIFDMPAVRWLMRQPASLYGLGIPPAQYRALSQDSPEGIGAVLRQRLERLACDFDIHANYFAWQAFGRRYASGPTAALPPYLQRRHFEALRARSERLSFTQRSFTETLRDSPAASFDRYVLLDAQDWMNDADLTDLWTQITRTARPGARVIFRTAADERLLPGRIPGRPARRLGIPGRAQPRTRSARSLLDLRRLPSLYARRTRRMSEAAVLMDRMYRRQRHIYDATRKFYLLGRDATIAELGARANDGVLEIGCGTGRNLVKNRAPLSPGAAFRARRLQRNADDRARRDRARVVAARVRVAQADAAAFDAAQLFGRPSFERVMISYALSMIPPWREALAQAVDALAPGGSLHIVDFGDYAGLPAPFRGGARPLARAVRRDAARHPAGRTGGPFALARRSLRDEEPAARLRDSGCGREAGGVPQGGEGPLAVSMPRPAQEQGWKSERRQRIVACGGRAGIVHVRPIVVATRLDDTAARNCCRTAAV